jgi:hypothetical protein
MNSIPHIEQVIKKSRLPRRVVVFNEEKGFDEIIEIVKYVSNIWGGFQTILIPYSSTINFNFIKMLKEYDPDYIYYWDKKLPENLERVILNNCFPLESITIHSINRNLYPESSTSIILNEILGPNTKILNLCCDKINEDYYSLIALTGCQSELNYPYIDYRNVENEIYNYNDKLIGSSRYERVEKGEYYPFDISLYGVDVYSDIYEELDLNLVIGSTIQNYCLYFNLCRIKKNVIWIYDNEYRENIKWFIDDLISTAKRVVVYDINNIEFSNKDSYLGQISEERYLNVKELNEEILASDYEIKGNYYRDSIWFKDNVTVEKIKPICLNGFEEKQSLYYKFLTEIELDNYKPINKSIEIEISDFRISKNGITFFPFKAFTYTGGELGKIKNSLKGSVIKKYSLWETVAGMMKKMGYTISMSNQGKYTENILNRFEKGLSEVADLLVDEQNKKLFNLFIDTDEKIGISINKRKYLTICDFERVFAEKRTLNKMIEYLMFHSILEIGFIIKCPHCSCTRWISLDDIRNHLKCIQCNNDIKYNYNMSRFGNDAFEPQIYYKLDEIFFLAWKQDFNVPVETLNYYNRQSKVYFEFITEIDVLSQDGKYCEIDFICNCDGKLIIGECKKNNEIETKQIDSYMHLAHNLGFDVLVFSTMKEQWKLKVNNYLFKRYNTFIKTVGAEVTCLDIRNKIVIPLIPHDESEVCEVKLDNKAFRDIYINLCKINNLTKESKFDITINIETKYLIDVLECIKDNLDEPLKSKITSDLDCYFVTEDMNAYLSVEKKMLIYINYATKSIEIFEYMIEEGGKCSDVITGQNPILRVIV